MVAGAYAKHATAQGIGKYFKTFLINTENTYSAQDLTYARCMYWHDTGYIIFINILINLDLHMHRN